jgi:exopolyphosphatase/pppGpp-phosphohydrolase
MNMSKKRKFFKRKSIESINMGAWYNYREAKKASRYAKENANINGVKEAQSQLRNSIENYEHKLEELKKETTPVLEERILDLDKKNKYQHIFKLVVLSCLLVSIIGFFVMDAVSTIGGLLFLLLLILSILGLIPLLVFHVIKSVAESKYLKYIKGLDDRAEEITKEFSRESINVYNDIDACFMASLSTSELITFLKPCGRRETSILPSSLMFLIYPTTSMFSSNS